MGYDSYQIHISEQEIQIDRIIIEIYYAGSGFLEM